MPKYLVLILKFFKIGRKMKGKFQNLVEKGPLFREGPPIQHPWYSCNEHFIWFFEKITCKYRHLKQKVAKVLEIRTLFMKIVLQIYEFLAYDTFYFKKILVQGY